MQSEWSEYFRHICSMHNGEIAKMLENTEYKALGDKLKETDDVEIAEQKAACYYEQAALVALRHFIDLIRETNVL